MEFNIYNDNNDYIVGDKIGTKSGGIKGGCSNAESDVFIPSFIEGHCATIIGRNAFQECNKIARIEIGEGFKETRAYSFCGIQNLKEVVIPSSLIKIGDCTFEDNYKLENVIIKGDSKLTTINTYAFNECYVLSLFIIPRRVKNLGNAVFSDIKVNLSIFSCTKETFTNLDLFRNTNNVRIYSPYNEPSTFDGKTITKQYFSCKAQNTINFAAKTHSSITPNIIVILILMK